MNCKNSIGILSVIIILLCGCQPDKKTTFTAASYNLRNANSADSLQGDGWGNRCPIIAGLVQFHEFDIFGTQEGLRHQLDSLKTSLPKYDYIGVGRNDGKKEGEHAAIFYRIDKFEYKDTGFEFLFFNLHMDHIGKQARVESALLVQQKMKEIGENLPAILTGDFNVDQTHRSYLALTESGTLRDAFEVADLRYATNGTFNGFDSDNYTESRIDHVFVTPTFHILKYGVLTDSYRRMKESNQKASVKDCPEEISIRSYESRIPSDHFPVMVKLEVCDKN